MMLRAARALGQSELDAAIALADELQAANCFDRKYVILGHSLGGWMAHELVCELVTRGMKPPEPKPTSAAPVSIPG